MILQTQRKNDGTFYKFRFFLFVVVARVNNSKRIHLKSVKGNYQN